MAVRSVVVVGIVLAGPVFLFLLAYGLKHIYADWGLAAGTGMAVACVLTGISFGGLVDYRRKDTREMLEQIERKHRIDLSDFKARLNI